MCLRRLSFEKKVAVKHCPKLFVFSCIQMYAHQGLLFTLKGIVFVFSLQICKSTISMVFLSKDLKQIFSFVYISFHQSVE